MISTALRAVMIYQTCGLDKKGYEKRIVFHSLFGTVNKDKSEPYHRVMKFGFLLSPPDVWGRQLAAGAVSDDKSEPNASSISVKVIVFVPSL